MPASPGTNLIVGEGFSQSLGNTLLDTNVSGVVSSADVAVSGSGTLTLTALSQAQTSVTLTNNTAATLVTGDATNLLDYLQSQTVSVAGKEATGDFTAALNNVVLDNNASGTVTVEDIVITGTATATAISEDDKTVTFNTTLANGATFTVTYLGRQAVTIPNTGLTNGEAFTLGLNLD